MKRGSAAKPSNNKRRKQTSDGDYSTEHILRSVIGDNSLTDEDKILQITTVLCMPNQEGLSQMIFPSWVKSLETKNFLATLNISAMETYPELSSSLDDVVLPLNKLYSFFSKNNLPSCMNMIGECVECVNKFCGVTANQIQILSLMSNLKKLLQVCSSNADLGENVITSAVSLFLDGVFDIVGHTSNG